MTTTSPNKKLVLVGPDDIVDLENILNPNFTTIDSSLGTLEGRYSSAGILSVVNQPGFQVLLGLGTTSVPANTNTLLSFTGAGASTHGDGAVKSGVYTVPEDGIYLIYSACFLIGVQPNTACELRLFKGSTQVQVMDRLTGGGTANSSIQLVGQSIRQAVKGDTFKVYVSCGASGITIDNTETYFGIAKLS
jgi:hypothetical protein